MLYSTDYKVCINSAMISICRQIFLNVIFSNFEYDKVSYDSCRFVFTLSCNDCVYYRPRVKTIV